MQPKTIYSVIVLTIFLLFTVSGCIFNSPSEMDKKEDESVAIIDQEYGGFSVTDEAEAFGDQELANEFADDETVTDLIDTDPAVANDMNNAAINAWFLRITWGKLIGDSTATEIVDWSGKAEISKGTLAVLKKIRFEVNDKLVLPRENRQTLEWVSFTKPHFDGLFLTVIDNDTTQSDVEGVLTLNIGTWSRTFSFTQLDSMDLLEAVGANGDEISIISRKKSIVPFAGGFLEGKWIRKDSLGGVFKGRWIDSMGMRTGHLKGIWGVNRFGHQVLYGKWIDLRGHFQGLLAGNWGYGNDHTNSRENGTDYCPIYQRRIPYFALWLTLC